MEDNNTLLMKVLKSHYKDRPNILDEALRLIKEYSRKKNSSDHDYDETLQLLRFKMNDLPENILRYFLNMVPKSSEYKFPNMEVDIDDANTNITFTLLSYLNNAKDADNVKIKDNSTVVVKEIQLSNVSVSAPIQVRKKPVINANDKILQSINENYERTVIKRSRKIKKKYSTECKSLLDICAEFVIDNKDALNRKYKSLKHVVWSRVNSNKFTGENLQQCYTVIKDLNKKMKWMRMLDMEEVPLDIIQEEYGGSDILLKENEELCNIIYNDPFVIKEKLSRAVANLINDEK